MQAVSDRHAEHLAIVAIILLAGLVFWPGMSGGFLLDDGPNLGELQRIKYNPSIDGALSFIFDGRSGATGRPVALGSFAPQYEAWPNNPRAFLLVNLALHLVNGLLLWLLLRRVFNDHLPPKQLSALALLASALWLVHPMHVSAVLYPIQRMTLLAGTFSLLALLAVHRGLQEHAAGRQLPAMIILFPLFGLCSLLAVGSKEIGILIPLYVLCLWLIPGGLPSASRGLPRYWRWIALYLPLLLVTGALVTNWQQWVIAPYSGRDFTLVERLLTEPRILLDYLLTIVIPTMADVSLFYDNLVVSRGILSPPHTILAIAGMTGLLIAIPLLRRRAPVLAFGLAWFFAGHLLESSFIALELKFEHRNYLPMVGPLVAVSYYALVAYEHLSTTELKRAFSVAAVALLLLFPSVTAMHAATYGKPTELAVLWARENPHSIRARTWPANILIGQGRVAAGLAMLEDIDRDFPNHPSVMNTYIQAACLATGFKMPSRERISESFREGPLSLATINILTTVVSWKEIDRNNCPDISLADVDAWLRALVSNKAYADVQSSIYHLRARLLREQGDLGQAIALLDNHYGTSKPVDVLAVQVIWLLAAGQDPVRYQEELTDRLQENPALRLKIAHLLAAIERLKTGEGRLGGKASGD